MTEAKHSIQLLGFDPNWVCIAYDLITYNDGAEPLIKILPNLEMEVQPNDGLKELPFELISIEDLDPRLPMMFGASSPKNKYAIERDFRRKVDRCDYTNLVARSSIVSISSELSPATQIDHQCVISAQTKIGFGVTIKRGAKIGHHNQIGDFVDVNPGVITSGHVTIEPGCEIGTGAVFKNGVTIGSNTFIGMGSVVTKDIPPNSIAYGNPCRVMKENKLWNIPV